MTARRAALILVVLVVLAVAGWGASRVFKGRMRPAQTTDAAKPAAPAPQPIPHITATLFYASSDGQALAAIKQEVPLADGVVAQAREILQIQFEPPPSGYLSTIPKGTTLKAFYVTERGDAFVDISGDISKAHPGGTLNELLTVDTIVDAVTANLPAVHRVQILVDGQEVDTIAGHVDVRHPLERDMTFVK